MKEMTYEKALQKLQKILGELQNDELPIDQLIERASEAKDLVTFCREKLRDTEKKLTGLIGDELDPSDLDD